MIMFCAILRAWSHIAAQDVVTLDPEDMLQLIVRKTGILHHPRMHRLSLYLSKADNDAVIKPEKADFEVDVGSLHARMSNHSTAAGSFHDHESETSSRESNAISLQELDAQKPWYRRTAFVSPQGIFSICGLGPRRQGETESERRLRRRLRCRWISIGAVVLTVFGAIAGGYACSAS